MTVDPERLQLLRHEGVIREGDLPPEHLAVINGLTHEEVDVIIAVKRRLVEADRETNTGPDEFGHPGFMSFIHF
jgi:hypothetical protein